MTRVTWGQGCEQAGEAGPGYLILDSSPGAIPRLQDEDRKVYGWISATAGSEVGEIAAGTGLQQQEVEKSLGRLIQLRLARTDPASPFTYFAMAPETARVEILGPLQREIDRRQFVVDRTRAVLHELADVYQAGVASYAGPAPVEVIASPPQAAELTMELAASCRSEILCSQPDAAAAVASLYFRADGKSLLSPEVRVRTLLTHTARFRRELIEHMRAQTQRNVSYRTRSDGFMPLTVFDGQVAVFSHHVHSGGIVLVRDPAVVAFAVSAFERAWNRGIEFCTSYDPGVVDELSESTKRTILHLMVQGVEDRLIARRLNMSLRSCQRHIEVIMRRLGAKNRMHAGFLVSERGLLREQEEPMEPGCR
ncbi:LuxR C-terminal-related transcriptional regulator [Streptomyces abikoensis]|uniref:LuxR C-terminal-related transcriptional regulator n=1 Tax=Streptomyces abikoensis TaxID=97398 RepID=UPI0016767341|nr:LuxR C-terminal-related transcriptional regulator [Streptomyces abikoensis]